VILVNAKNEVTITKNISSFADLWSIERVKAAKGSSQDSRAHESVESIHKTQETEDEIGLTDNAPTPKSLPYVKSVESGDGDRGGGRESDWQFGAPPTLSRSLTPPPPSSFPSH